MFNARHLLCADRRRICPRMPEAYVAAKQLSEAIKSNIKTMFWEGLKGQG